ncbi:hypothetical protein BTH72_08880, partial [Lactobacillus delbrueckii subsp. bulgaricus]|nr:hypothetical protein [Lactobacillus delbrueckii subsp. bulgaricus]
MASPNVIFITVNRNATIKDKRTIAAKRRIMAQSKGTDVVIQLLNQALKAGLTAKYVMFDTWFSNPHQIVQISQRG